ncbi:hypothetical protein B0J17DRAFT_720706 [Rhizoctonia solani]|nr:hypothetical protein B0J17DRAFT_720706 [Rhizoctonia solani]
MKMIYFYPLDRTFSSLPAEYGNEEDAARNFVFYVNVETLSNLFTMEDIETWAKERLVKLAHRIGDDVNNGFKELTFEDVGREKDTSVDTGPVQAHSVISAFHYTQITLVEAILYAKAVSHTSLFHDSLHLMQYSCASNDPRPEFILAFFRTSNLRDIAPSLFGFLFILIVTLGSET